MNNLKAVENFAKSGFESGKLIDMDISFPSFAVTRADHRKSIEDLLSERVNLSLMMDKYKTESITGAIDINDLIKAQENKAKGTETVSDKGLNAFSEKLLPTLLNKDSDLNFQEINKTSFIQVCAEKMKMNLWNISQMGTFEAPYGEKTSTFQVEKDKFAASLILIKEKMPQLYKQVQLDMKDFPDDYVAKDLKELETKPNLAVINHIMANDKSFAERAFPREVKELNANNKNKLNFN